MLRPSRGILITCELYSKYARFREKPGSKKNVKGLSSPPSLYTLNNLCGHRFCPTSAYGCPLSPFATLKKDLSLQL